MKMSGSGPKKKMVIVPFKKKPELPDNFEKITWEKLEAAIHAVNTKVATTISKEDLYRAVEDLCLHKMAAQTYEKLRVECDAHITSRIDNLVIIGSSSSGSSDSSSLDHTSFLESVDAMWQDHCEHMITIRNIFLCLDRSYALQTAKVLSIWDLGLAILREKLESRNDIEEKLIIGLLSLVEMERKGRVVDRSMMRRLLRMLYSAGLYTEKFQYPFLKDTERFFIEEGNQSIELMDAAAFMSQVERRLVQANDMVMQYLDVSTRLPLLTTIEKHLLAPHVDVLLNKGLGPLLDDYRISELKRMYFLFDRVHALPSLCSAWIARMIRVGEALVKDESRDKTMVEELLTLQLRADEILKSSFNSDETFRIEYRKALDRIVNARQGKPAELIARFVDRKMRGEKGQTHEDIEAILCRIMNIFCFLNSKDVFEAFYKKLLSKRLLLDRSASQDLERSMLMKLKAECGSNYTAKLEGMFSDIEKSKAVMSEFIAADREARMSSSVGSGASGGISASPGSLGSGLGTGGLEGDFTLITMGIWPQVPNVQLALPPELAVLQARYEALYYSKYKGRRLTWAYALDRCNVSAVFPKGKKVLEISLFQTLVLLEFNKVAYANANGSDTTDSSSVVSSSIGSSGQVIKFTDLKTMGLEDGELRRTLQSLACGPIGTRVLVKEPKGKDVNDSDVFRINHDFSNQRNRIKIPTIQPQREVQKEAKKTHEEVFRDRQYQIDAVIVRTMKARKQLSHNALIPEILAQLKFPATTADIKKRIETLIERDYMERSDTDSTVYVYIA